MPINTNKFACCGSYYSTCISIRLFCLVNTDLNAYTMHMNVCFGGYIYRRSLTFNWMDWFLLLFMLIFCSQYILNLTMKPFQSQVWSVFIKTFFFCFWFGLSIVLFWSCRYLPSLLIDLHVYLSRIKQNKRCGGSIHTLLKSVFTL